MKRSLFIPVLLGLLLSGPQWILGALEIEGVLGVGNMNFDPEDSGGESIVNELSYLGYLNLKGDFFEKAEYNVRFERDSFFKNTISAKFSIDLDYLYMEFGPFLGIWDEPGLSFSDRISGGFDSPDAGIMGGVKLAYPGVVFMGLKGSSTLNFQRGSMGNNFRESAEINVGFWLPHVIPTFSASIKTFTRPSDDIITHYELTRLWASADIFAKNIPLLLRVDFGWEILKRSAENNHTEELLDEHELWAMFAGVQARWQVSKPWRLIAGMEIPIFAWTEKPPPAKNLSKNLFFYYQFYAGAAWTYLK